MAVRVVHVRHMRMLVHEPLVAMPVRMGLAGRIVWAVRVLMVRIVHMRVAVLQGLMDVFVLMVLGQVQPDPEAHEQAGDQELEGDGLAQKQDGHDGADERRGREVGSGARGAEMAQRHDEERKADAITEETHDPCQRQRRETGKTAACKEAKRETDGAGDEAFELDDLQRIGERHFTREVVVEPPCSARTDDGERTEQSRQGRLARPREHGGARDEAGHAECDAPVEILMKDEPRHQRRGDTLERQQQRGGRGVSAGETGHQEDGADHAAGHDRAREPGHILALEGNLRSAGLREKERTPGTAQDGDAEAGAAIEKARENGRVDASEQHLGRRGRDAEEGSRKQSKDDGVMVHGLRVPCDARRRHSTPESGDQR